MRKESSRALPPRRARKRVDLRRDALGNSDVFPCFRSTTSSPALQQCPSKNLGDQNIRYYSNRFKGYILWHPANRDSSCMSWISRSTRHLLTLTVAAS